MSLVQRNEGILLKKLLMHVIEKKVRTLVPQCLTDGVWLTFAGIDAINFHFTNGDIHTSIVELALIKNEGSSGGINPSSSLSSLSTSAGSTNSAFDKVCKMVQDELIDVMNSTLLDLHNDESMTMTKQILGKCSEKSFETGNFFEVNNSNPNRKTIEFIVENNLISSNKFVFIEIRIMENITRIPFDRFGLRYLPLGFVYSDINTAQERYGGSDWKDRQDQIKNLLEKKDLTLSFWTTSEICRECYPNVGFKRIGYAKPALANFDQNLINAPQIYSKQIGELRNNMNEEVNDMTFKDLNLTNLIQRGIYLGFLPDISKFRTVLDNYFNNAILRELHTELSATSN